MKPSKYQQMTCRKCGTVWYAFIGIKFSEPCVCANKHGFDVEALPNDGTIIVMHELTKFIDFIDTEDNRIFEKILEEYTEGCIRIDGETS